MVGDIYTEGRDTLVSMDMWSKDTDLDDNATINRVLSTSSSIDIYLNGFINEMPADNYLTFTSESTFDDLTEIEDNMEYSNLSRGQAYVEKINLIDNFDDLKLNNKSSYSKCVDDRKPYKNFDYDCKQNNVNMCQSPEFSNDFHHNSYNSEYLSPDSSLNSNSFSYSDFANHQRSNSLYNQPHPSLQHPYYNSVPSCIALPISPSLVSSYAYTNNNLYDPNPYQDLCLNDSKLFQNYIDNEPCHINDSFCQKESALDTIFDIDLEEDFISPLKEELCENIMDSQLHPHLPNVINHELGYLNENNLNLTKLSKSLITSNSYLASPNTNNDYIRSYPNSVSLATPLLINKSAPPSYSVYYSLNSPSYSSISSTEISTSPYNQKERKKFQNKIAAAKYRTKKKEESKNVLIEESYLKESNTMLKNKLACLSQEINMLKNLVK